MKNFHYSIWILGADLLALDLSTTDGRSRLASLWFTRRQWRYSHLTFLGADAWAEVIHHKFPKNNFDWFVIAFGRLWIYSRIGLKTWAHFIDCLIAIDQNGSRLMNYRSPSRPNWNYCQGPRCNGRKPEQTQTQLNEIKVWKGRLIKPITTRCIHPIWNCIKSFCNNINWPRFLWWVVHAQDPLLSLEFLLLHAFVV